MTETAVTIGAISSQIVKTNIAHPAFLQARCPSCHQTNSVKALKGKPTLLNQNQILHMRSWRGSPKFEVLSKSIQRLPFPTSLDGYLYNSLHCHTSC